MSTFPTRAVRIAERPGERLKKRYKHTHIAQGILPDEPGQFYLWPGIGQGS